jgi:hypothetical protein
LTGVARAGFYSMTGPEQDPRAEFQELCNALRNDDARNQMICTDVVSALNEGRSPLLLTERVEHLEQLAQRLSPWVKDLVVFSIRSSARWSIAKHLDLTGVANRAHFSCHAENEHSF